MKCNHTIIEIAGDLRHDKEVWIAKSLDEWDAHSKTTPMLEWVAIEKGLI